MYMYIHVHMTIPYRTVKFNSANIFISATLGQTTKFKDRQYFRLYGIQITTHMHVHSVSCIYMYMYHVVYRDLRHSNVEADMKLAQTIKDQFLSRVRIATQVSLCCKCTCTCVHVNVNSECCTGVNICTCTYMYNVHLHVVHMQHSLAYVM